MSVSGVMVAVAGVLAVVAWVLRVVAVRAADWEAAQVNAPVLRRVAPPSVVAAAVFAVGAGVYAGIFLLYQTLTFGVPAWAVSAGYERRHYTVIVVAVGVLTGSVPLAGVAYWVQSRRRARYRGLYGRARAHYDAAQPAAASALLV